MRKFKIDNYTVIEGVSPYNSKCNTCKQLIPAGELRRIVILNCGVRKQTSVYHLPDCPRQGFPVVIKRPSKKLKRKVGARVPAYRRSRP